MMICIHLTSKYLFINCIFLTYSQSSGASGSLITRLTSLALKEVKGRHIRKIENIYYCMLIYHS